MRARVSTDTLKELEVAFKQYAKHFAAVVYHPVNASLSGLWRI